jgi:hypothetical protein
MYSINLIGQLDSMNEEKIVEVKNRRHKLFKELRDYEKVQIYMYMYLFGRKKAVLVESYKNKTHNIDIDFDANYMDYLIQRLEKIIQILIKMRYDGQFAQKLAMAAAHCETENTDKELMDLLR